MATPFLKGISIPNNPRLIQLKYFLKTIHCSDPAINLMTKGFIEDLDYFFMQLEKKPKPLKKFKAGWHEIFYCRLKWMCQHINLNHNQELKKISTELNQWRVWARSNEREKLHTILFSQIRAGHQFSQHVTESTKNFPYTGKSVVEAAEDLVKHPNKAFTFAITIAWHRKGFWVTTNNRSFSLFCIAKCKHFRIRIAPGFTADQEKRFTETPRQPFLNFNSSDHQSHQFKTLFQSPSSTPSHTITLCEENNTGVVCVSNNSLGLSYPSLSGSHVVSTSNASATTLEILENISAHHADNRNIIASRNHFVTADSKSLAS